MQGVDRRQSVALPVYCDAVLAGHIITRRDGQSEAVLVDSESLGFFNNQDAAIAALIRRVWRG